MGKLVSNKREARLVNIRVKFSKEEKTGNIERPERCEQNLDESKRKEQQSSVQKDGKERRSVFAGGNRCFSPHNRERGGWRNHNDRKQEDKIRVSNILEVRNH